MFLFCAICNGSEQCDLEVLNNFEIGLWKIQKILKKRLAKWSFISRFAARKSVSGLKFPVISRKRHLYHDELTIGRLRKIRLSRGETLVELPTRPIG